MRVMNRAGARRIMAVSPPLYAGEILGDNGEPDKTPEKIQVTTYEDDEGELEQNRSGWSIMYEYDYEEHHWMPPQDGNYVPFSIENLLTVNEP